MAASNAFAVWFDSLDPDCCDHCCLDKSYHNGNDLTCPVEFSDEPFQRTFTPEIITV